MSRHLPRRKFEFGLSVLTSLATVSELLVVTLACSDCTLHSNPDRRLVVVAISLQGPWQARAAPEEEEGDVAKMSS